MKLNCAARNPRTFRVKYEAPACTPVNGCQRLSGRKMTSAPTGFVPTPNVVLVSVKGAILLSVWKFVPLRNGSASSSTGMISETQRTSHTRR
ncbi:MAG TPA: hypothetical protein VHW72_15540 [Candidatus Angelobacter sp.]|nr:hypothetical protein [Candidatus Angelobacter sp.]